MRFVLVALWLGACGAGSSHGPSWPRTAERENDGGESLAPRQVAAASTESAEPAVPTAETPDAPAAAPATAAPAATTPTTPTITAPEDTITVDEIVIEIEDD